MNGHYYHTNDVVSVHTPMSNTYGYLGNGHNSNGHHHSAAAVGSLSSSPMPTSFLPSSYDNGSPFNYYQSSAYHYDINNRLSAGSVSSYRSSIDGTGIHSPSPVASPSPKQMFSHHDLTQLWRAAILQWSYRLVYCIIGHMVCYSVTLISWSMMMVRCWMSTLEIDCLYLPSLRSALHVKHHISSYHPPF
jgi:hypothetical protein